MGMYITKAGIYAVTISILYGMAVVWIVLLFVR